MTICKFDWPLEYEKAEKSWEVEPSKRVRKNGNQSDSDRKETVK